MSSNMPNSVRRFTHLPSLVQILYDRKITLLSPANWSDKNDSHFMEIYKKHRHMQTVLALCFTSSRTQFHHWKVFANGPDGIYITFNTKSLLHHITKQEGIRYGMIKYLPHPKFNARPPYVMDLPFLKRKGYEDEHEFRVVYESKTEEMEFLDIPISLSCIELITFGPELNENMKSSLKTVLKSIPGCSSIRICQTTITNSSRWKQYGETAID